MILFSHGIMLSYKIMTRIKQQGLAGENRLNKIHYL